MDLVQNFNHATETRPEENPTTDQKHDRGSVHSTESGSNETSFNCNICFDSAHDPVVTLCGHLYCWACIFKWLHIQPSPTELGGHQQVCPVCKSSISQTSLIPLYCNGPSHTESNNINSNRDLIPPRPTSTDVQISNHHHQYFSDPYGSYSAITSSSFVSTTMARIINPTIGLLGELVNPRMSGSAGTSMFTFLLPSSYAVVGWQNNPRTRRQELQFDKSLNQVSIFLFCGLVLCLLLF